ncbi:DUF1127 domain-containing protein [Phaeobacter gallaeciensis]|uniref:DUF1127 domain-containing protein n=2 Tax=Roseobacteraceae TaxID=2854170 RepID=A0A366X2Y9_9RHOB|nr:DUF1127 domain-containing protein [Falsiruegeria litorea]MBT8169465.1 DUF1127 domain-containing protein [Falsiruegeria litorea]RBW55927.1 DUF1127 domain-containing protein [Phaeobacter gallaeciensis]
MTGFISILAKLGAQANAALKTLQMARMLSTLSGMSDTQLAQIGISRSNIPKYAETLMAKEYRSRP